MEEYSEIYIDPEESLKSFLEKVQTVDRKKIIVVIHQRSSIFMGQVNIELINKYAQRAEKELIFITNLKKSQNLLQGVGFEVYSNLEEFKSQEGIAEENNLLVNSQQKKPKLKSKSSIFKKMVVLVVFFILSGAVYFYFHLPVVTIKVTPVVKTKQTSKVLTASTQQKEVDFNNLSLALIKKEIKLRTTTKIEASGQKSVGVKYAQGVITFVNNTKEQIVIPAETMVATRNGIKYKTMSQAVVPKLQVDKMMGVVVGAQAGKEEVNIRALEKGKAANVSKGRIVEFVTKSYPVKLVNPEATTGGKNKLVKQITAQDIDQGLIAAEQNLDQQSKQELADKFGAEMIFFKDHVQLKKSQFEPQNKAAELGSYLTIKGKTTAVGWAVNKNQLKDLVFAAYHQQLGTKFALQSEKIKIKSIKIEEKKEQQLKLKVVSTGKVMGRLDQVKLIDKILGKKVANVKSLLDNMNEVANYKISPNNQVNVPEFKYGVKLIIGEPVKE